ncbi:MAG: hypothetical protein KIT69_04425 [Propionibacteriaceae bacterium]|nr:hypothetical protein [Propionibacteriaceae bacterium]
MVALSSLGLAAAVVASVGVVGLGAATSVAAVPRPDAVGAPLPVAGCAACRPAAANSRDQAGGCNAAGRPSGGRRPR